MVDHFKLTTYLGVIICTLLQLTVLHLKELNIEVIEIYLIIVTKNLMENYVNGQLAEVMHISLF